MSDFNWTGAFAGGLGALGGIAFDAAAQRQALDERRYEEERQARREEAALVKQQAMMKYGHDLDYEDADSGRVDADGIPLTRGEYKAMSQAEKEQTRPAAEVEEDRKIKGKVREYDDPDMKRIREEEESKEIAKERAKHGILSAADDAKESKKEAKQREKDEAAAARLGMTYNEYLAEKDRASLYGKDKGDKGTTETQLATAEQKLREAYNKYADMETEAMRTPVSFEDWGPKALPRSWKMVYGDAPATGGEKKGTPGDLIGELLGKKPAQPAPEPAPRGILSSSSSHGTARKEPEKQPRKEQQTSNDAEVYKRMLTKITAERDKIKKIPFADRTEEQKKRMRELLDKERELQGKILN